MSISATERTAFAYLLVTALTALFGGIYEVFSHGVWSGWMVYAFAFPLALGAIPFSWMALRRKTMPPAWTCRLHHAGVAALTVGSLMQGVMEIYGTTNRLITVYWLTGAALIAAGCLLKLLKRSA